MVQTPVQGRANFKVRLGCSGSSPDQFWTHPEMEITQHLWALSHLVWIFCSLCLVGISFIMTCSCWFLSFQCAPLRRFWLHLFYNSLQVDEESNHILSLVFSPAWTNPVSSFHTSCDPGPWTYSGVPKLDMCEIEGKKISNSIFLLTFVIVKGA